MTLEKNLVRVFVCVAALSCSVTAFAQQGAMQLQHKGEMIEKYTDVSGAEKTRLVDVELLVSLHPKL